MKVLRNYFTLFSIAGLIIALDQWTKHLVRANLPYNSTWLPESWVHLEEHFRVVHWYNTGAAFGLFKNGSAIFTALAFVVAIAIIWFYGQVEPSDYLLRIPLAMQLGGAVGNLIDRLLLAGKVTDWISIGKFAVFNVADASISVGTALMLIGVWILEKKEKQARAESDPQAKSETGSPSETQASA